MKVRVTVEFHDINDLKKVFRKGDIHDFEDSRAANIIALGYGVKASEEEKPVESVPEPKEAKPKVKKTKKND